MTGTTYEEQFTREGKSKIPDGFKETLARYQQIVGQSMRDVIQEDVWVQSIMNKDKPMAISDVRYQIEVKAIEGAGGIVIRLIRPDDKDAIDASNGRDPNHSSEIDLDKWDFKYVVVNDGTLLQLKTKILDIIYSHDVSIPKDDAANENSSI